MYNVLLVDDEKEIRQGLMLKVDWEKLNLRVAGEASNGQEAVERLQTGQWDVVITDMRMPVMDGVRFLEYCSQHFPAVRQIVLTGYDDFQYAHAAVKNKACDLLLKPVTRSELSAALGKVVGEIERERQALAEQKLSEWRLSSYLEEMKEHFIISLVKAYPGSGSALQERIKLFQLEDYAWAPVRFIAMGILAMNRPLGEADPDSGKLRLPFELLCRELAGAAGRGFPVFRESKYPDLLFTIVPDDPSAVAEFNGQVSAMARRYLKREALVAAGEPTGGVQAWRDGCLSAVLAWYMQLPKKLEPAAGRTSDHLPLLSREKLKLLRRELYEARKEAFEKRVEEELAAAFQASNVQLVKLIFQICLLIEAEADSMGLPLDHKEQIWMDPERAWELNTVDKARRYLFGLSDHLFKHKEEGAGVEPSIVEAMKEMIATNYMNDLNLSDIAEQFHYNPSYLSDLFKTKTGQSFIQYLTDVRMSKALRLLGETPLSLSDIAELTGFSNASYFSTKFKKTFSVSPSEYRQTRGS